MQNNVYSDIFLYGDVRMCLRAYLIGGDVATRETKMACALTKGKATSYKVDNQFARKSRGRRRDVSGSL